MCFELYFDYVPLLAICDREERRGERKGNEIVERGMNGKVLENR